MIGLLDNPFAVLGVTPRSSKAEIHDAVEDALLDAEGVEQERRLEIARQALISPNERLKAELGFLLELRPAEARKALRARTYADWRGVARDAAGISGLNALVEAICQAPDIQSFDGPFRDLIAGWADISERNIAQQINEERAISGFTEVQIADVRASLADLRTNHALRTIETLEKLGSAPQYLADLLVSTLKPEGKSREPFVTAALDSYANRVGGALVSGADRVLATLETYSVSGEDADFATFEQELEAWDVLAQPLQIAAEAKGADEENSKALYEQIRSVAIDLANDEDRHHEALKITNLSQRIFAELPGAAEFLKKDARTLNDVIASKTRDKHLLPLAVALEQARDDLAATSRQLSAHGFSASAPKPVGPIWSAYVGLLSREVEQEIRDIGANLVRNLAITLFNDRQKPVLAKMLTSQLVADADWFSTEVRDQIEDDDGYLNRSVKLQELLAAMKREDWGEAKALCESLIRVSPETELDGLRKIEAVIDEKRRSRNISRLVWGGIAVAVIGGVVLNQNDRPAYEEPAYDPPYIAEEESTAPSAQDEENEIIISQDSSDEEVIPSTYPVAALSRAELRYCLRQSERLDLARDLVDSFSQQTRFNSAVSDFNSRCSSFSYDETDMSVVRSEISTIRDRLRSEAADIVGANSIVPPPTYTAPSNSPSVEEPATDFDEAFDVEDNGL